MEVALGYRVTRASAASTFLHRPSPRYSGGATHVVRAQDVPDEVTVTGSRIVRRDLDGREPDRDRRSATARELEHDRRRERAQPAAAVRTRETRSSTPPGSEGLDVFHSRHREREPARPRLEPQLWCSSTVAARSRRMRRSSSTSTRFPSAAIARVETITGGASAVYGPDALAGVMNFVLKRRLRRRGLRLPDRHDHAGWRRRGVARQRALIGVNTADGNGERLARRRDRPTARRKCGRSIAHS